MMTTPNDKNVSIESSFGDRVRSRRNELRITKTELVKRSGLSIRTIQDIEAGRKKRIQEKTLLLLAEALEVSPEHLRVNGDEDPTSSPTSNVSWKYLVGAMLVIVIVSAFWLRSVSINNATWTLDHGELTVSDSLLGSTLWRSEPSPRISKCIISPWSDRHLLVGLNSDTGDGGRLLCLNRANADTLWAVRPDFEAFAKAFGPDYVYKANFRVIFLKTGDLDGDDVAEVIVGFNHGRYYPHAICVVEEDGRVSSQYSNRGHIFSMAVTDIDDDGLDEIIATGTHNAHDAAVVLLLDDEHRSGASVDAIFPPPEAMVDSAAVRLMIPSYSSEFMVQMEWQRLAAMNPRLYDGPDGEPRMSIDLGGRRDGRSTVVDLDSDLIPTSAIPSDALIEHIRAAWPDSLRDVPNPTDPAWLADWLTGYHRYEAGHWPPANDTAP